MLKGLFHNRTLELHLGNNLLYFDRIVKRSTVAQWLSALLEIEGLQI